MRGLRDFWIAAAFSIGVLSSAPAAAAVVDFTFTDGSGVAAHGQLTTTGGPNGVFGVDVTGMTGWVGANAITAFIANPGAPNTATSADGLFYYDDNYDPSTHALDVEGLLFDVGSTEYNLFNNGGGVYQLYPARSGAYGAPATGALTTAVPEPATWALMLLGLGLVGAALRGARGKPALSVV
ncbi:MAG: PEPxxWA-CTERM sorting domain-containing protein [Caulobacteraceae bacterium]